MAGHAPRSAPEAQVTPELDLVLFDCDGVLVDSEGISARCVSDALKQAGYVIDEAEVLERFLGISNPAMCGIIENETGRSLPDGFLDALRRRLLAVSETELHAVDGVVGAVESLTVPVCVASSSHPERIRRYLEITGLDDLLGRNVFSAAMVERGKPAPDLFLLAAERMGAHPHRCVVIEDSEAGVLAGKAAGMTVFGFTGGSHVQAAVHGPKLAAVGADLVFDDLAALPHLLDRFALGRSRSRPSRSDQG